MDTEARLLGDIEVCGLNDLVPADLCEDLGGKVLYRVNGGSGVPDLVLIAFLLIGYQPLPKAWTSLTLATFPVFLLVNWMT